MPNRYRRLAAISALLGWLALALQLLLSIQLTQANGRGALPDGGCASAGEALSRSAAASRRSRREIVIVNPR